MDVSKRPMFAPMKSTVRQSLGVIANSDTVPLESFAK